MKPRTKWTKKGVQEPCPRCLALAFSGEIRLETVMPLPDDAPPLAIEDLGEHSPPGTPICHDCQAAENLAKCGILAAWVATEPGGIKRPMPEGLDFAARRVAIGNDRQEQLRLPVPMRPYFGLVAAGYVRPSEGEDALDKHHDWLKAVGVFGSDRE